MPAAPERVRASLDSERADSARAELVRRALAELVGTAFLLATIVGSGIMATRLTGDVGVQLLINAGATAAALTALILAFGPVSGAHFNPVVTLADRWFGGVTSRAAVAYIAAQFAGALTGVVVANVMFDLPVVELSANERSGGGMWLAEVVATLGLLLVILGVARRARASGAAIAVGLYIGAAYFFTSSTSFANPAVTIARTLSDTFAGIGPRSTPAFVLCQLTGLVIAVAIAVVLFSRLDEEASSVVVPHEGERL